MLQTLLGYREQYQCPSSTSPRLLATKCIKGNILGLTFTSLELLLLGVVRRIFDWRIYTISIFVTDSNVTAKKTDCFDSFFVSLLLFWGKAEGEKKVLLYILSDLDPVANSEKYTLKIQILFAKRIFLWNPEALFSTLSGNWSKLLGFTNLKI